ncbi:MAG: hypothetical protein WAV25_02515 [Minisyncoccia bacterium]
MTTTTMKMIVTGEKMGPVSNSSSSKPPFLVPKTTSWSNFELLNPL